jgi:hypothetical protein
MKKITVELLVTDISDHVDYSDENYKTIQAALKPRDVIDIAEIGFMSGNWHEDNRVYIYSATPDFSDRKGK